MITFKTEDSRDKRGTGSRIQSGSDTNKFTSYTRDGEFGDRVDYAMARYYAAREGRFMSPDPGHIGANPANPQSWNAYVYTLNDPINLVDPDGLFEQLPRCSETIRDNCRQPSPSDPGAPAGPCYDAANPGGCGPSGGGRGTPGEEESDSSSGGQRGRPSPSKPSQYKRPEPCTPDVLAYLAGYFDSLSFGMAPTIRAGIWETDPVSATGGSYDFGHMWGSATSLQFGAGRLLYAGSAKTGQLIARSAEDASAVRRMGKIIFRGTAFPNVRNPTYAQLLAKGKTPAQIWESAGRTNASLNTAGKAAATTGAIGVAQQGYSKC